LIARIDPFEREARLPARRFHFASTATGGTPSAGDRAPQLAARNAAARQSLMR